MRKFFNLLDNKAYAIIALIIFGPIMSLAKPAYPGLMTRHTADGETITVRLVGDETFHQYFTEDGIPLIEKEGNFYYCDYDNSGNIIDSQIKATEVSNRSVAAKQFIDHIDRSTLESRIQIRAEKSPRRLSYPCNKRAVKNASSNDGPPFERGYGLFSDVHFPAYGNQKAIVILVEYKDVKFNDTYDAHDYFSRMLNENNFSDYGGTGSAAQYFRENSQGAFTPEFDVFGPIQLEYRQAYYGGNHWVTGEDRDPGAMVKEACDALDDIIDFNDYDRDHDGIVDNIFIFYAGLGEASGGGEDTVWPHSWNMSSAGYPNLYYDGVLINTYGCTNEWETYYGGNGRPDGVGTFIHEFSHVMGLPDLYATSFSSAFTPGEWSALDYGPYNNNGMTPPNYGAFERYALGWIKPREIDSAINATLQPIDQNVCGIIRTSKDTEFFLVENRQQTGWDTYIPHHGMLIWHVDYDQYVWDSNSVNDSASHQYVDIVEADGTANEDSIEGDPFPGITNKTSFTSTTNPAMKTWSNEGLNYPITDIAENDGIITFKVLGGSDSSIPELEIMEPTDVSNEAFTLNWSEPAFENDVYLSVYSKDNNEKNYVEGLNNSNVGHVTSYTVTDVVPETTYYYTVMQSNGWESSGFSEERSVFTGKLGINRFAVEVLEATDIHSDSFTANWEALSDATSYSISVYTKEPGEPFEDFNGFDNGKDNLGDWTVSDNVLTYGMASYAGEAVPSLRVPNGSSVTTPAYKDCIRAVSFWHRGNSTSEADHIDIYAVSNEGNELVKSVQVVSAAGGETVTVDALPEKTTQISIKFVREGASGYLALDDVLVFHGNNFEIQYLDGLRDLEVGNVLSYKVVGLQPDSEYFYTVRATDGTLLSLESAEARVMTDNGSSSVETIGEEAVRVSVKGLAVEANVESEIVVSNCAGIIVARGKGRVILPSAGLYIISVPEMNYVGKVMVRG